MKKEGIEEYRTGAAENFAGAIQSPYRAAANIVAIVQRRDENYFRTLTELTNEMLRDPSPETYRRNARRLSEERIRQREAFGAVASEITNAYPDLLYSPFYYLRGR